MISNKLRIARMITLAGFALTSAAWAAPCTNASLSGTYGFLHNTTDSTGLPASAAVSQITFDPATATFSGETTASHAGVIITEPLSGTYAVTSNCTGTGTPAAGAPFSIVVTSTGFLAAHVLGEGFAVQQGSPKCNNAGVQGTFGLAATGVITAGSDTGAVDFIGQLKFAVSPSGDGVISGHLASSEDGTFLTLAEEPVTGYYTVATDCQGTATIAPKGHPEMHFRLFVVNGGNEMLAVETDANTVVSGTLQR